MISSHSKSFELVKDLLKDLDYTRKSLNSYIDEEACSVTSKSIFACKVKFMRELCEEIFALVKGEPFEYESQTNQVSFSAKARTTKSDETGLKLDTRTLKSYLVREEVSVKRSRKSRSRTAVEVTDSSDISCGDGEPESPNEAVIGEVFGLFFRS